MPAQRRPTVKDTPTGAHLVDLHDRIDQRERREVVARLTLTGTRTVSTTTLNFYNVRLETPTGTPVRERWAVLTLISNLRDYWDGAKTSIDAILVPGASNRYGGPIGGFEDTSNDYSWSFTQHIAITDESGQAEFSVSGDSTPDTNVFITAVALGPAHTLLDRRA